jgi:3-oxoacyl-[acyl-carrier-protein] synthase I
MTRPAGVLAIGMVTGVGLSAPASCAAMRCGINHFEETSFIDRLGAWIVGSEVQLEKPFRGLSKLTKMATLAIAECLEALPAKARRDASVPLFLCVAEEDRPGRLVGLGGPLLFDIERELDARFHPESMIIAQGRVGSAVALFRAQKLIHERMHRHVLLVGVDSYLTGPTLAALEQRDRLLTERNSDGFIPGEAAAAVLLGPVDESTRVISHVPGFARESATYNSEKPLRGDGMMQAVRTALKDAGIGLQDVDYRVSDLSGEQYRFKEVALATARILRERKVDFGIWHPADCVGEIGAAALPVILGVYYYAAHKRYLPGPTFLAHLSNDDDKRAALVLSLRKAA